MAQLAQPHQTLEALLPRRSRLATSLWWVMLVFSLAIVAYATTYFVAVPDDGHFARFIVPLRLHIAGGMGALLVGPWQFSRWLRSRALNFHRWLGRFYLLEVLLGSAAGLFMSVVSKEGMATHFGFGILALLWFFSGLQAYRLIRRGQIEAHRQWMIRNFALTFAAVTLRIYMPLMLGALHWSFHLTFITVSWLCWIPNALIAEWMIHRETTRRQPALS
ncbi:MAG TPA: DUF2306 domain-containing protein [Terriglobales bacterium]|nr:DUF2306 domain-containing protein [Terriglobales bacterium]